MNHGMHSHTGRICLFCLHCVHKVCFQMFPQFACQRGCIVTLVAYVRLSTIVYHQMRSQTTCLRKCKVLLKRMQSYTCYILLTFFHCAFSNVSSNCLSKRMHSRIGCICFDFSLLYVFKWILKWFAPDISNVSSNYIPQKRHIHIGCSELFIHCGILCVSSNRLHEKIHSHIDCNCYAFLLLRICKSAIALWENLSGKIV